MLIRNNGQAVASNKQKIEDVKKRLTKHSINYGSKTDLTAKREAKKAMEQQQSLISQYKNILERDLKNVAAINDAFKRQDNAYNK